MSDSDAKWSAYGDAVWRTLGEHTARQLELINKAEAECGDSACDGRGEIVTTTHPEWLPTVDEVNAMEVDWSPTAEDIRNAKAAEDAIAKAWKRPWKRFGRRTRRG